MRGQHSRGSVHASHPAVPGSILGTPFPRFIKHHCYTSGQWHSNEPVKYKAGVCNSSWGVHQPITTKIIIIKIIEM